MISKNYFYLYMFFVITLISASVQAGEAFASQTSQTVISTVSIVRPPSLSLTPTSGVGGTVVIVTGSNFVPNASIDITFVGVHGTSNLLDTVKVDATGSFAKIVKIPSGAYPGTAMISAQQKGVTLAQTVFTVPFPAISLNPASGPAGTEIMITGSDFALDKKVKLFVGHDISNHLIHIGEVTTDDVGSFATNTSIPSDLLVGIYFVSAREDVNNKVYAAASFIVTSQPTTTTPRSSVSSSVFGQPVTFTATVSPSAATGTVKFVIDGISQTSVALSSSHALLTLNTLSVGTHVVTAQYSGDTNFAPSTSATLTQTVAKDNTKTTLSSSLNPSTLGQRVTFTATLSPVGPGNGTQTGTVTFSIDGISQLPLVLSGNSVTVTTNTLTKGTHQIVAKYSGDSSFNSSTDTITQTVH